MQGPVIDEVHQQINSWIHQVPGMSSISYLYIFSLSSVTVCDNDYLWNFDNNCHNVYEGVKLLPCLNIVFYLIISGLHDLCESKYVLNP